MKFPWHKYKEILVSRRNTLQVFITNECNAKPRCTGCFARNVMATGRSDRRYHMSTDEYIDVVDTAIEKGCKQINILGGEPLLHPQLCGLLRYNQQRKIKTTVYTNGSLLNEYNFEDFHGAKLRVSIYNLSADGKAAFDSPQTGIPFEANFMISNDTTLQDILETANYVEEEYDCKVFFIYDMRELDNLVQDFFFTTDNMIGVMRYKSLVHKFLRHYKGKMDIHVSKRGVFESTVALNADTKCHFANYFIGGKIIQCPWDVVNLKYQNDYEFGKRFCQHNNTCLMNKVVYRPKGN